MARPPELSPAELAAIAGNAASIGERLAEPGGGVSGPWRPDRAEARLKEWLAVVSRGDRTAFERRLAFDQLTLDRLRPVLGAAKVIAAGNLPAWTEVLNQVLHRMPSPGETPARPYLDPGAPVPFEEALLPFVDVALDRLAACPIAAFQRLPHQAHAAFARSLLQKLSWLCARVLIVEFRTFLACRQLDRAADADALRDPGSRALYQTFVAALLANGWAPLFCEYPVLARLMATALLQWVESTGAFAARFAADLPCLRATFLPATDAGTLTAVNVDLSDPHHGGQTVLMLEFASGARLVYKPKSLAIEVGYFRLIDWLNARNAALPFYRLTILPRDGYGWVAFVENRSCTTEDEVRRFYRRSGAFLCLVYTLNGMDFHFENLVACGEHPVPVDLETIFHHHPDVSAEDPTLAEPVAARLRDSVLRTHFLPNPVKLNDRYYDISAIARSVENTGRFEVLTWVAINTDQMDYRTASIAPPTAANLPRLNGRPVAVDTHVGDIVDGFREMYRLLLSLRGELLDEAGVLAALFRTEARLILRSTTFYGSVIKKAIYPRHLRSGVDFDIQLDALARTFVKAERRPRVWPLLQDERAAVWRTDVPKFAARGDGTGLRLETGECVSDCFLDSAWNRTREKIRRLGAEDLAWQISLITGAMDARDARMLPSRGPGDVDAGAAEPTLSREALLNHAVDLARTIDRAAIRADTGEPGWLVLKYLPGADQFALRAMDFDLYSGRCGVALFFAAAEKLVPGQGFGASAHATLALVRRWLARATAADCTALGLGGLSGMPSVAYALARTGTMLGDPALLEDAGRAAMTIDQGLIEADTALDVVGGAAGAILCLLACHDAIGAGSLLDKAAACGRHLLNRRETDPSGFRTWPTQGGRHLTGFSHGAAGIAYALLRLSDRTGEPAFREAAREAIVFENAAFAPDHGNWPDHREGRPDDPVEHGPRFMVGWCHGAPGIGLARAGSLAILDTPEIRFDIEAALATTRRHGLLTRDHICCGNAGLAETLLVAGRPQEALRLASRMTARAVRTGTFAVTFRNGFFNTSLFQGAAGVGYQLLRLAGPQEIPSVLLLA